MLSRLVFVIIGWDWQRVLSWCQVEVGEGVVSARLEEALLIPLRYIVIVSSLRH